MANPNQIQSFNQAIALDRNVRLFQRTNANMTNEDPEYAVSNVWVKRILDIQELGFSTTLISASENVIWLSRWIPNVVVFNDYIVEGNVSFQITGITQLSRRRYSQYETRVADIPTSYRLANGSIARN